ncbi:DUF2062 domain-containing protein [Roseovarius sp. SYSU LYC5161]|uniref:DUF2062 domain-containing protein n=1 Tax=Roseovarius halophilus (ex Wu et al. 2025) TaxID=3376060 RepID=UPI002872288E|nr:DUF2062 domain-containing protein [Roseovarius sp.]
MVFKRRDKRPLWKVVADFFWPKGGWTRGFHYVKHRLRRLPDPPHRIARGIFAGIFVTFSPFFGLHFFLAVFLAWVLRGNIVAALLSTFVGNPLTFVPIAAISLQTGYFLLGMGYGVGTTEVEHSLGSAFVGAGRDLKHNIIAIFTDARADWSELHIFYEEVFLPYMVGGLIPGVIAGLLGYYISLPLIQAYQNRRKGLLKAKWAALKEKAAAKADGRKNEE